MAFKKKKSLKVPLQQKTKVFFANFDDICWRENVSEKNIAEHYPFSPPIKTE